MAATMLARLVHQTARVTTLALRQQYAVTSCLRPFSTSNLLANKLLYSDQHEWIKLEKDKVYFVGISDHAQELLGDIVYVELPEVGLEVEANGEIGCVESVKAASDIYSPVAGKIAEVNEKLRDAPDLVNKSPLDEGWIYKMEVEDPSSLNDLMDEDAYNDFLKAQADV